MKGKRYPEESKIEAIKQVTDRRYSVANAIFGASADFSRIEANAPNYTDEVLFIAADCSTFTGEELQSAQMSIFPKARLVVIPNAGHEMFSDNPAASLIVIREYLETHNNSSKRDAVVGAPS